MASDHEDVPSEQLPTVTTPPPELAASDLSAPPGALPSLPPPVPAAGSLLVSDGFPKPGDRLNDFELVRVLGAGAFATVYLARHVSLDRQVALKVTTEGGIEARTLASLEHPNIVQVYWEIVDRERDLRLLCMQYVPGTTLEKVIRFLGQCDPRRWSGSAVLDAVDGLSAHPAALDPAALRERESLGRSDFVQAVCRLGAQMADALAHAHRHGVLHRDIKAANILINVYGRPFLADFNLALDRERKFGPTGETFGGTLGTMAPEHLDAFNPEVAVTAEAVDHRSDIYSLGVVLFELLTGRLPFPHVPRGLPRTEVLRLLAEERRRPPPSPQQLRPEIPDTLDRLIRRCLHPDPLKRYQSAGELAEALEGCSELHEAVRQMPSPGPITRALLQHTRPMAFFLVLLPHVIASAVNITYTSLRIASQLDPGQQTLLAYLTLGYNLLVFSGTCAFALHLSLPITHLIRRLHSDAPPDADKVARVRRRALSFPFWGMILSSFGWLPGGVLLPMLLNFLHGPVGHAVFVHFFVSFLIAGLIAVTYNVFANQYLALRVLYTRLWTDGAGFRQSARLELRNVERRLQVLQLLAGLIPLVGGAILLMGGDRDLADDDSFSFRLLVLSLILLGMAGFGLAVWISSLIGQTVAALTGSRREAGFAS